MFNHHHTTRPRFPSQSVIDCYSILSTRPPWTHRCCNTHCEASIAAYLRMPFFTSTIPMPPSVTSMDHCDHSMHITDLNPGFVNQVLIDLTKGPELHCSMRQLVEHPAAMVLQRGCPGVQHARLQPRPKSPRSALSLSNLIESPAPDDYIDHVSRLPISVTIYHYNDFVEITKA